MQMKERKISVAAVFDRLDRLKPVYDVTYKITMFICKILLIGDILITSMAVLGRFVSFIPDPAWSEEIVLTFMGYITMLSASLALRRNGHIRMTALDQYLPEKVVFALDMLADLAILFFAVIMLLSGWKYCTTLGSRGFYTSIPTLSKFWLYFPIPVAGVSMILFELEIIYRLIRTVALKGENQR